jgi:SAM-dependent methyltransferase
MRKLAVLLGAGAATAATALWWRTHPSACPYSLRWSVAVPHPVITRTRLLELLGPQAGEQILEIGPGTGYYTVDVAAAIVPGRLAILDLQREMLDYTMRQAERRALRNVDPAQGDARALPYEDESFDGAFLVTTLGEIPDQDAALAELARVLKPGGRLVTGEIAVDPHFVTLRSLEARARPHGLHLEGRRGVPFAYFARLVKDAR